MIFFQQISSPVGPLLIAADDAGLRHLEFEHNRYCADRKRWQEGEHPVLDATQAQLAEYFSGKRQQFNLPLAPQGTDFQRHVWQALAGIAYGQTISYAELAKRVQRPNASRAVGAANGRNPLPIVLPCHRVIGSNGALTGFGGGLPIKTYLLRLEGALSEASEHLFQA